ncbi:MAG: PAS domain-containing sensor histidine kinase [Candidatus Omnitrophica bacterium]|nr:PAS domain-containing sensor histidine kinase [Candidatus Omnitrophota bacterium]
MSLVSSFTFILISISAFFSRPTAGFMGLITSETESGIMVRKTIGGVIITTFFLGWIIMLGHFSGLYDEAMGYSLLIVFIMVILSIIVWTIGLSLHHIECKRMRIEKELEEQKDFSCGLIQNSTAPTFVLDTSHRVILWNKACEELTGIKGYELINTRDQWKAFYEYKRPCLADIIIDGRFKDLAQFYTIYGNSPILHDGLHGEGWFRNLGGRKRYIVFDAAPVYNVNGELISSVETLQDMTERKRMEEALIKSEERYRELIQNMPVGLYRNTPGPEGKFIMANPSMARLFGFESTEEFIAMKVSDLYEESGKRKELSDKLIAEGKILNEEIRFKKRGGAVFWGAITAKTVRNQFGEIEYFDGMLEDITERKHIEELKNDFVALVSHQLKTPAAEIKGYLYNMLSGVAGELNTKQREYIEDMYEISSKEYRLVTDLLNVSRLERGVFSVNIKPVVLQEIAGLAISNNINFAQTKKINIQIQGNEKDIVCLADKDKLVEALSNVIHNAIKFTDPESSITLVISEDAPSGIISVHDTGIGMGEETLRRLFTKEQTLQGAPLAGGGAGLGLYIAKQFMLLQKGNITVQSELGKGSTFSFFIPLAPQSLTEKNKEDA